MRNTVHQIQTIIAALEDNKFTKNDIHITYIDITNAFSSIDHPRLLAIIEVLGYPLDIIKLIGTTSFLRRTLHNRSPIEISRDAIQGDFVSPYLFIIFLEPSSIGLK